jgi:metal-dependent hydrolase
VELFCITEGKTIDTITYELIRSDRKTISLQVKPDGRVIVRAPQRLAKYRVVRFVKDHEDWILKQQKKLEDYRETRHVITDEERRDGVQKALKIFPERTAYFAARMGVNYGRITIREQKTRWGSCSSAGNLNFNWRLVLMPPEILDYVVVHELAHRKEMNHSSKFWAIVEQEMPDYQERKQRLKELGGQFI